jgi:hypothetical protein
VIYEFHVDVLFAATYAVFLVLVAAILERVALHSRRLSGQIEASGFKYHAVHNRWECPGKAGSATAHGRRVAALAGVQ